jgi:transcription antitermination factor NusG
MRINDRFAVIRDDDSDFRRIQQREKELTDMPPKSPLFQVGQQVKPTKGMFIEFIGHITALDDKGRASVLIDLLNSKVRLHCSVSDLNPS